MQKYIKHTVLDGDTVQGISQKYLGTPERWLELVTLNGLDFPFTMSKYREKGDPTYIKYIGEAILVPAENVNPLENLHKFEIQEQYDRLLGEDLALFEYTDSISLTDVEQAELEGNLKGDLRTVRGIKNLKQALLIRFSTPLGSLLHHPDFGTLLQTLIGKKNTFENRQKIRVEIERTVRGDNRVKDITIESLDVKDRGALYVSLKIVAIGIDEIINMGMTIGEEGVVEWA
jgi:phage baseplate assembly protein W